MRNSNIELLRIVCIVMIVTMHVYGQYNMVDDSIVIHSSIFANSICNTGVSIFVLISGYYGIRFKLEKWVKLYNITTFYAILFLVACLIRPKYVIDTQFLVESIFPVFCNKYWFVTSYLLLMALADYIQKMLDQLSNAQYKTLVMVLLLFLVISPSVFQIEIFNDYGKGFMNMLSMYILGRYIRNYSFPLFVKNYALTMIVALTMVIWLGNEMLFHYLNERFILCRDNSIFIIALAVSIFYLFVSRLPKHNKVINNFAGYVFPIYLIHGIFIENLALFLKKTDMVYVLQIFLAITALLLISITIESVRKYLMGGGIFVFRQDNCQIYSIHWTKNYV